MENKKEVLIIAATHGDEKLGVEIIKNLSDCGNFFDYIIGNPMALKKTSRFIDKDLNRSYPGKKNSCFYEERRAYFNIRKAKKYKYVIDIHEANHGSDDFIIIPNNTLNNFPFPLINLKKIVLWAEPKGALCSFLNSGIELEFGTKHKKRDGIILKATKIIENFMKNLKAGINKKTPEKKIFYVYGKLEGSIENSSKEVKDFRRVNINDEIFYPLLTGQYKKEKIICYKMKKIRPLKNSPKFQLL